MSIIKDAAEAIQLLSDLIDDTRSIVKAINDGREYLARNHPEAGGDFAEFFAMSTIDVDVIEVFPSASSIPPDYATNSFCMVGIWTKRGG